MSVFVNGNMTNMWISISAEKVVPRVGLEPTRQKTLAPKASAAAVTPPGQRQDVVLLFKANIENDCLLKTSFVRDDGFEPPSPL